ncbi:MAG: FAD-dependent oxidoreductase [Chloroflexi bacterium]|nr:FAD-dependent oxidoreductase [Chloroflexota bacterium]
MSGRRHFLATLGTGVAGVAAMTTNSCGQKAPDVVTKKRANILSADVLVVGGGVAGIGAAVAAAKAGAATLLIENYGIFGGVASWSLGMCMNQMRPGNVPRGYIHELLYEKLSKYGDQAVLVSTHQFFCNVEYLKVAFLDMLDEVGCRYLVHLRAVDALSEGGRVTGVVVATKSGLAEIRAKTVIDCTGDADVAFFSGAATMTETGNISPQTLQLNLANVAKTDPQDLNAIATKAGKLYPHVPAGWAADGWGMRRVSNCHHYYLNHAGTRDLGNFDVTDPLQFSRAECLSRRQVVEMTEAIRTLGTGVLKNAEIVGAATQIGVRESRRVKGLYVITEADAVEGRKFDDAIAWRSGYMDIGFTRVSEMRIHQVPYRSILPEKVDGLLTAGRCISATHEGASAGKSMGNCIATGHAAGIAAALAARDGVMPRDIAVNRIRDLLVADGVDLNRGGEEQPKNMDM